MKTSPTRTINQKARHDQQVALHAAVAVSDHLRAAKLEQLGAQMQARKDELQATTEAEPAASGERKTTSRTEKSKES